MRGAINSSRGSTPAFNSAAAFARSAALSQPIREGISSSEGSGAHFRAVLVNTAFSLGGVSLGQGLGRYFSLSSPDDIHNISILSLPQIGVKFIYSQSTLQYSFTSQPPSPTTRVNISELSPSGSIMLRSTNSLPSISTDTDSDMM